MATKKEVLKAIKDHFEYEPRFAIYVNKKIAVPLFFHSIKNAIDFIYNFFPKDRGKTKALIEEMVAEKLLEIKEVQ